ncbi:MAG TPA: VOC family protein [Ideonella sp.]|uniref:VOC family protein n=1 Tax=Ideonella sp. TaxID=1929293 RepID=UPI002CA8454F|nr:VOC family protein [Ideonella sp.]HSI48066.1 VOC family protein [Ideonella sp.]
MATLDHIILKVNDLAASVAFYTQVLGFALQGQDGPFTVLRVGFEHCAFAVTSEEFEQIFARIKAAR